MSASSKIMQGAFPPSSKETYIGNALTSTNIRRKHIGMIDCVSFKKCYTLWRERKNS
jgi:hypothetical protein